MFTVIYVYYLYINYTNDEYVYERKNTSNYSTYTD